MKKLTFVLLGFLILTSCDGFLVESPKTQIAVDQYFTTPEDARSTVNAIYRDGAGAFYHEDAGFRGSRAMMGGYMSGYFDNEGKGERIEGQLAHDLALNPINMNDMLGGSGGTWARLYRAISRANTAIRYIPEVSAMSETEAQRLLAEARFFRALNYFYLVKTFGDVPLVLQPVEGLDDLLVSRDASQDVYNQIIEDLNWALDNGGLPNTTFSDNGFRVTRSAALTLLSHVHLQNAGYPLQNTAGYGLAADAALEVIQDGVHSLAEHNGAAPEQSAYNAMRTSDDLDEYIWAIEYAYDISSSPLPRITIPGVIRPSGIQHGRTLNMYRPINRFMDVYEADDLRGQNKQIFYNSFEREGTTYNFNEWAPYTWHEERALFEDNRGDMNTSIYRYAQVLLIAAEAIARSEGGVTAEAVEYLTDVRSRAFPDTDRNVIEAGLSVLSVDAFVEEVWKERLRELALEFVIWPDIQRTRQYPVTDPNNPGEVEFVDVIGAGNNQGQTYQEKHLLYPIPDDEMQRNPELTQNDGY